MRVSERQRYKTTESRVENARDQNLGQLDQISTLKRINKISDDPIGAGKVIRGRDRVANLQQFQKNAEFSKSFLERSETALASIGDNLLRAKELAVGMANSTYGASERQAASREVAQILGEVVKIANTSFAGRFVFSGFRTSTPPMSEDGKYLGDDGIVFLQTEDGDFRQANVPGRYIFEADPLEREAGHFNMIDSIRLFYDGLTNNSVDDIRKALEELEHQLEKTSSYQATLGSLYGALGSAGKRLEGEEVSGRELLSKVEEVDMFKATSDFHRSEQILQSTLLASNKMLQPSLLNFMQ